MFRHQLESLMVRSCDIDKPIVNNLMSVILVEAFSFFNCKQVSTTSFPKLHILINN